MDIVKEATALFKYLEAKAQEKNCYLKLATDTGLSITNRIFTDIPFEELSNYVPVAPEKKSIDGVSVSLVGRLVRITDINGKYKDIPVFGNDSWEVTD